MNRRIRSSWALLSAAAFAMASCTHGQGSAANNTVAAALKPVPEKEAPPPDVVISPNAEGQILSSEVTAVTVYSDRARVTRTAQAEVKAEPSVFIFRGLPGWVDDGSVRVAASAGRILDVQVEREFLARSSDESYRKAEEALKALNGQLAAITDEIAILDAQKVQIESIKAFSLDKISKDTVIGNISVASYSDVVTFISDALRATAQGRREAQRKMDELTPEVAAAQARLNDMNSLLSLEETTVKVTLQGESAGNCTIELMYMMPGATWEPMHELRVNTAQTGEVEVTSFAVVTQTSGEDWVKAELSFSTQSTVQSMRIPELEALKLGGGPAADKVLTSRYTSFSRAQQAYEGQSQLWNRINRTGVIANETASETTSYEEVLQSNIQYLQTVQTRTVQIFESLENRGTTAHFKATAVHRVRGDGQPARMRIGYSQLKSTQKIIAVPEQSLNAARTLDMVNSTGQALLPGKVALYQDGAFIGMTDIDFIAQEERFSLYFSVADHLKLSRELDRKQSSIVQRKGTRITVTFIVTAENLLNSDASFTLADRIPVSEDKDIKVSNVRIAPAVAPDTQGLLRWELKLGPREKRAFSISYTVEYPPEIVYETKRDRAMYNSSPSSGSMPKSKKAMSLKESLVDLESMF